MRSRLASAVVAASVVSAAIALALHPARSPAAVGFGAPATAPQPRLIPAADRQPAPSFSEPVLGRPGLMSGPHRFTGEVVVVAFWSSWCTPCRAELMQLERAWKARPPGSTFLGVDVDDGSSPAGATMRSAGVGFDSVVDGESSAAADYGIAGTPTIVFIDPLGREAAVSIGQTSAATILSLLGRISSRPTG